MGQRSVLVDEADAPLVLAHHWHVHDGRYARTTIAGKKVYLHRLLLGAGRGQEVDHISGDGFDCRRANLRIVTHAENLQNRPRGGYGTSRYRGVSWHAASGRWFARAKVAGRDHFGGYFADEDQAGAAAADLRARLMPFATS